MVNTFLIAMDDHEHTNSVIPTRLSWLPHFVHLSLDDKAMKILAWFLNCQRVPFKIIGELSIFEKTMELEMP